MTKKPRKPRKDKGTGGVKGAGSLALIDPKDIDLLRKGVFNLVKQNVPRVREVLQGTRQWNPQQVKLYLSLLNKVMPDLSQSHNEHHVTKSIDDMSADELRSFIADEMKRTSVPHDPSATTPIEEAVAHTLNNPLILSDVRYTEPE